MRWPPRRSLARQPRIAAAIGSRCSRIPIRASSGVIPTSWSSASCATRSTTIVSASTRSPSCPCEAITAVRYQLMPTVDRWVVHRACDLLGEHSASVGEDIARFAINLSGQSLQDESFLEFVIAEIKASHLPPGVLCFELTETATIGNLVKAQNFMRRLQDLGCQFALDDFGTGVSSLAYLKDLSVNYLKIDGSFVRDAITNSRSESMIKAIAQLAKVMCMETIAEYVETDALRARMADLGVDYGQGFAMGRAQPLEELLRELAIYEATVSDWAGSQDPATEEAAGGR